MGQIGLNNIGSPDCSTATLGGDSGKRENILRSPWDMGIPTGSPNCRTATLRRDSGKRKNISRSRWDMGIRATNGRTVPDRTQ